MKTEDLLKKVRKIEIKTRGLSNHIFAGEYHSAFKGRGMSFSEVREYQFGDDVRSIDWNVTARFNHPFVKVFEEERELTVMLMIDVSQSDYFGTNKQFKNDLITEVSAILSFSAINNNDKVGVIFFTDQIEEFIPPKKGKTHILRIIRELIDFKPRNKKTDISQALRYLNNVMKKRSIVFLFSDFVDSNFNIPLSIAAKRHDIVGVRVIDQREQELPNVGLMRLMDAESGEARWINTSSRTVREQYKAFYLQKEKQAAEAFLKSGADMITLQTGMPYINTLMNFFKRREARR